MESFQKVEVLVYLVMMPLRQEYHQMYSDFIFCLFVQKLKILLSVGRTLLLKLILNLSTTWETSLTGMLFCNMDNAVIENSRTLTFLRNNFESIVPPIIINDEDEEFIKQINTELQRYRDNMEKPKIRDGLKCILNISKLGNGYLQVGEPWKLLKSSSKIDK